MMMCNIQILKTKYTRGQWNRATFFKAFSVHWFILVITKLYIEPYFKSLILLLGIVYTCSYNSFGRIVKAVVRIIKKKL